MITTALILALLSAGPEGADCGRQGDRCPADSNRSKGGLAWFEAFPASGAGLPSAANLCDTLTAAEKVGNWWCLNGDGTMASGSAVTLTATGSPTPTTSSDTYCPNGPACGTLTSQRFAAGGGYASAADTNAPTAFTACLLFDGDDLTNINFFGKGETNAANIQWLMQRQSNGRVDLGVSDGTTFSLYGIGPVASPLAVAGGLHVACGRYVYSGTPGTSSAAQSCLDGTCGTASAVAVGPLNTVSKATRIGYDAAYVYKGRVLGAFFTASDLGTTRIAQIARAVLADAPTGARGEALSETRASVQFCESSDGTGTLLPNNRPCVTRGGATAAQGSFVQSLLQTEALGNAAWADVATPTITSDSTVSAGGTLTADTVDDNNAAAFEGRSQTVTVTAAAAYTMSCYAKAGTLAKIRLSLDGTTGDTTTLSSSSWTRVSVTDVSTSGVSVSAQVLAGTATTDTGTIYVWGCNVTAGTSLRPYIPATSASVTTAAEVPYLTLTNAPALNSIEATIDTPAAFATNARVWGLYKDVNNIFDAFINTGSGNKLGCYWYVGGVGYTAESAGAIPLSTLGVRVSCSYSGGNGIACVNGTCTSTALAFTNFSGATRIYPGAYSLSTGYEASPNYVIKSVKADPNAARFR